MLTLTLGYLLGSRLPHSRKCGQIGIIFLLRASRAYLGNKTELARAFFVVIIAERAGRRGKNTMEEKISPLWGVVGTVIVGVFFYLFCSLLSWDFDIADWNIVSRIIMYIGKWIMLLMLSDVIRQFLTGDRYEI